MKRPVSKPTHISLVGGGSGGHLSPLISLSRTIRRAQPGWRVSYVGVVGDKMAKQTLDTTLVDELKYLYGGKYRRYERPNQAIGTRFWGRLADFSLNFRGFLSGHHWQCPGYFALSAPTAKFWFFPRAATRPSVPAWRRLS